MTPRAERRTFAATVVALWSVFVVQAVYSPVELDDWFQLRYWRDHELGVGAIWAYAQHNYELYNPRIGEVLLAIVDGSRAFHVVVTPVVQLAVLPMVFAIAFARLPRPNLRDLQLLVVIQTLIWLVIPAPGILYFYRPIATNYLWAFTITLALFVPYRLALAGCSANRRLWAAPVMLMLGWAAGMCNEHTGPTAMVAMAAVVVIAVRRRQLRAWMVAGMMGLYIGYPMLFFAPGQALRYGGLAARETPTKLLAERGLTGCLAILREFISESRLGLFAAAAALVGYLLAIRGRSGIRALPRRERVAAMWLVAAALAIIMTLFASPTAYERVFYAPGVLLAAALAIGANHILDEPAIRRFVVGASIALCSYHVIRFIETSVADSADMAERLALLTAGTPGTAVAVPSYEDAQRTRWHLGDDLEMYPWLRGYVGGELFDLARVDIDRLGPPATPFVATRTYDPPRLARSVRQWPTYRQLQTPWGRAQLAMEIAAQQAHGLIHFMETAVGVFDDPKHRPLVVIDWTKGTYERVDGQPYDASNGHFIRIRRATMPTTVDAYVIGCGDTRRPEIVDDGDSELLAVDETFCRGPFTGVVCEPDRCWVAGWY